MIVEPGFSASIERENKHHQLVAPDYAARLVDNADAVAVAVKRNADIGVVCS